MLGSQATVAEMTDTAVKPGSYSYWARIYDAKNDKKYEDTEIVVVNIGKNHASAQNGALATASSAAAGYSPSGAIDGARTGSKSGSNVSWMDATPNQFPDWLEVTFQKTQVLHEISVFTSPTNEKDSDSPDFLKTFKNNGIVDFRVEYRFNGSWAVDAQVKLTP